MDAGGDDRRRRRGRGEQGKGRREALPTPPHPTPPQYADHHAIHQHQPRGRSGKTESPTQISISTDKASLPLPPQIQIPYPWSVPSQQGRAGQGIHGRVLHIHIYIDGTYIQYMNVYNNRYLPMIYCICVSVPDVMVTSVIGHSFLPFSSLLLLSC